MKEFIRDHISYSSVAKYLECPLCWYESYVIGKTGGPSEALEVGTAYHELMTKLYTDGDLKEGLRALEGQISESSPRKKKELKNLVGLAEAYKREIYPRYAGRVDRIEVVERINIKDVGVPLEFRMDLSTIDGVVIDHKTVASERSKKPSIENSLQLDLYAYAYYSLYSKLPRLIEYHYAYKDSGKVEVVSSTVNVESMLRAVSCVQGVYKAIMNDIFYPSYSRGCRKCNINLINKIK